MSPTPRFRPPLDPDFVPAALWNRGFRRLAEGCGRPLSIALERADGSTSVLGTAVLPHEGENAALNERYVERLVKFLLWQKGGWRVRISGDPRIAAYIAGVYSPAGARAFDFRFMGESVYGRTASFEHAGDSQVPAGQETVAPLGRHLEGCRIGFDLGASDRKAAAVIDGQVVFSEEIAWDPSKQADPRYHFDGINDSLQRAAARLPRVDAIGGSAAGVYVNSEVRVGSLYRGIPRDLFDTRIRRLFFELQKAWGGIPFEVVNDGEVTALAGSMALGDNAVLGVAFGSSLAAGYVTPQGNITSWLNELAFVPVDYRDRAPADEWSGDLGVGVQYFSQQAVARLAPLAGIELPADMPFPARLVEVQKLMATGDPRARAIYETIGVYFGYTIAHFADFYEIRNLLVLGRVMTGQGGDLILSLAADVLKAEFPELAAKIRFHVPDETEKRHGQAVAAASLPALAKSVHG
jgi:predicted NBD/HSP70 family sugar kinase